MVPMAFTHISKGSDRMGVSVKVYDIKGSCNANAKWPQAAEAQLVIRALDGTIEMLTCHLPWPHPLYQVQSWRAPLLAEAMAMQPETVPMSAPSIRQR